MKNFRFFTLEKVYEEVLVEPAGDIFIGEVSQLPKRSSLKHAAALR